MDRSYLIVCSSLLVIETNPRDFICIYILEIDEGWITYSK